MINDDVFIGKNVQRLEDNMLAFSPSRQWEIHQVTFTAGNLDTEVLHNLVTAQHYKVRYQVVQSVTPLFVFHHPNTAWADGVIYLRASGPGTARIMLWLDDEENTEEPLAALNTWGEYPEIELKATTTTAPVATVGSLVGTSDGTDTQLGPGLEMQVSGADESQGVWSLLPAFGTFRELKFQDHYGDGSAGFVPLQIRKDTSMGANVYCVMPGPNTVVTQDVYLGTTTESSARGRFKGAYLKEGVGTWARTTYDGTGTSYTPTFSNTAGGAAVGNGTISGRYSTFGKTVIGYASFVIGATTNMGGAGALQLSLPTTARAAAAMATTARAFDTSAVTWFQSSAFLASTTNIQILATGAGGGSYSPTVPFTWAAGDVLQVQFIYEEA
jgi:hypothetical protein